MGRARVVRNRFGERLAEGREGQGWSQAVMAEKLAQQGFPCHLSTVAKLEANERVLSAEELGAYAAVFECSADALLGRATDPTADRDFLLLRLQGSLDDAGRQIAVILRDIDRVAGVDDREVSAAVRSVYDKLGDTALVLGTASALVAERRMGDHLLQGALTATNTPGIADLGLTRQQENHVYDVVARRIRNETIYHREDCTGGPGCVCRGE